MLYERFFKWITFYKRRHCEHPEWVKYKESSEIVYYDIFYYDHFKCTECGKKEKRDRSRLSGSFSDLAAPMATDDNIINYIS